MLSEESCLNYTTEKNIVWLIRKNKNLDRTLSRSSTSEYYIPLNYYISFQSVITIEMYKFYFSLIEVYLSFWFNSFNKNSSRTNNNNSNRPIGLSPGLGPPAIIIKIHMQPVSIFYRRWYLHPFRQTY